jgi:cysteine-rich repeat protein
MGRSEPPEECDDGNLTHNDGCERNCRVQSCGNSIVEAREECDYGNTTSGDGCDADFTSSACGSGVVATSEECDDAHNGSGDCCGSRCKLILSELAARMTRNPCTTDGCDGSGSWHACLDSGCVPSTTTTTTTGTIPTTTRLPRSAVLCAKPRKDGTFNTSGKIRIACKASEAQFDPAALGFCCGP